jgi:hypothetical protein
MNWKDVEGSDCDHTWSTTLASIEGIEKNHEIPQDVSVSQSKFELATYSQIQVRSYTASVIFMLL